MGLLSDIYSSLACFSAFFFWVLFSLFLLCLPCNEKKGGYNLVFLMGVEDCWEMVPPTVAPLNLERGEHWGRFDNSMNAVSFGFVATAILISMFLVMAIYERFLRPRSLSSNTRTRADLESPATFNGKLDYPSPNMSIYAHGVSVLMPGEETPTFIAHPAPAPCPPEHILKPLHQQKESIDVSSS